MRCVFQCILLLRLESLERFLLGSLGLLRIWDGDGAVQRCVELAAVLRAAHELGQPLLAQLQQLRQVINLVQDGEDVLGGHPGQLGHQVLDLDIEPATTRQ